MKKFITLTLALIMVLGCFAGCSGDSYKEDTVMVVNGTEVSFDEYCYWLGYSGFSSKGEAASQSTAPRSASTNTATGSATPQATSSTYTATTPAAAPLTGTPPHPSTRIRPTSSGALQTPRRPSSKAA